jgi:dTDP-4-dehydrorhamnose 3,5-epimerase
MKFLATTIPGVWQVHSAPHVDVRGSFTRLYCAEAFDEIMPGLCFVQVNLSISRRRGTLRGMHLMRVPAQEYKLVRCLRGRVFDVAADLRRDSPSYGRWFALELSEDQPCALLIPPGVAHGYQTLSDDAQLLYQHSTSHVSTLDDGVHHADPRLGIRWPLPVGPLSPRDAKLPFLEPAAAACIP